MAVKDCFETKEEQLYMLELLVDRLDLSVEMTRNIGTTSLCVRIEFIDLPPFDVSQEEFVSIKKIKEKEATEKDELKKNGPMDFSAGKSCLFTKQPGKLLRAMQTQPLKIGIYQFNSQRVSGVTSDCSFICKAQVPLSGCLCDQVSMAMNDDERLPKPYTLKNVYNLTDNLGKPSGTIAITLRLSCFGKSIVTHFALQEKSFIFKSSRFGQEFQCTRVFTDEDAQAKSSQSGPQENQTIGRPKGAGPISLTDLQDVIGLVPACQKLINVEAGSANIRPPLQVPTPSPHVSMDEPGFEKLTNAEKLNDRRYRSLVYRAYPNEPTCSCGPADNRSKPSTIQHSGCIGTGCTGSCCWRLRQPPSLQSQRDNVNGVTVPRTILHHCTRNPESNMQAYNSSQCEVLRMRGGGGCDETDSTGSRVFGFNPVRYDNEYDTTTRSSEMPFSNACKPRETSAMPGCYCRGKEMARMASKQQQNASAVCTRKPCMGVDCLIQAFKNAQEFVDSLGKVSGLEDLGLMDPLESPYFGRERDRCVDASAGQRKGPTLSPQVVHTPSPQYGSPGNTQSPRQPIVAANSTAVTAVPLSSATPFTIAVPGRTGVVREAIPVLPEVGSIVSAKSKKRDERVDKQKELEANVSLPPEIELGPCGEPKCKSRRKKPLVELTATMETVESTSKKSTSQVRPTSGGSSKMGSKGSDRSRQQAKNKSGYPGPGGDRNVTAAKSHVKVSRRIVRFVYSAGTTYPGVNYGHKNCVDSRLRVPANMGWLWNTITMVGKLKPRLGWKPGAISRNLNDLLKEAKAGAAADSRPSSAMSRSKKGKFPRTRSHTTMKKSAGMKKMALVEDEETEYPPTLYVHRKDGTYYVTMYPIKQETMDVPQLEEPTKPLQFKITRNKDDTSIASSSTASDMEIEFSPPAAVNRYYKKPNVIHVDTQVKQQEILDAFKPPASKKKEKKAKPGKK